MVLFGKSDLASEQSSGDFMNSCNKNEIEISIIVLTYFHEQYIKRALDTILEQKCDYSYEIIVADDCSQDNTIEMVNEYISKYPLIISLYTNSTNQGICANEFNAFLKCRGRYIVVTSGDDYWIDDCILQKQVNFLNDNKDFFVVCNPVKVIYTNGEVRGVTPNSEYQGREFTRDLFLNNINFSDAGCMFRNVFENEKAREKFSLMTNFSRDINDLTFCMFLFDCGRIFISRDIAYAVTARMDTDVNQHNYNTKYRGYKNAVEHVNLIRQLYLYYRKKYDFSKRYEPYLGELLYYIIKIRDKGLVKYIFIMPVSYNVRCGLNIIRSRLCLKKSNSA